MRNQVPLIMRLPEMTAQDVVFAFPGVAGPLFLGERLQPGLWEAIRIGVISRKRVASIFGDDVEDIDEENARDQQRAMRLGLKYDVYAGLDSMDFNAILQSTMVEDELEKLNGSGAGDPGHVGRMIAKRVYQTQNITDKSVMLFLSL